MGARRYGLAAIAAILVGCGASSSDTESGHGTTACTPWSDPATVALREVMTADHRYVIAVGTSANESRIFFGPLDHLVEGRVTDQSFVTCGDVAVQFVVDGTKYSAVYPYSMCAGLIPVVFDEGDDLSHRQPLTEVVPPIPATKLTLYCF